MLKNKYFLLLLALTTLGSLKAQSNQDCRTSNYQALVDLYYATEGWNWATTWNFSQPMEEWHGVQMQDGCVTGLYLSNNNLNGTIPASIGNLTAIRQLDLSANNLTGYIPSEIGQLTELRVLFFYQNQFYGEIPASIGQLRNLLSLNLQYNQLSGSIPETLGSLNQIHTLSLENNYLTGNIPETLGTLYNLVFLDLGQNQLSGSVPSSIGELYNLVNLELDNNYFEGCLPTSISQLGQLETLSLSHNNFVCPFPNELFSLTNLTWLYLDHNYFYGWLPDSFGSLSRLTILHLNNNILSGPLPNSLGGLSQLEEIAFQINYFAGCFPSQYYNFCTISTDFTGNSNLPGGGDFANFCATGSGSCEPIIATSTSEPEPEPEPEPEEDVCLSFTLANQAANGCISNRNLTINIDKGSPDYTVMLTGPLTGGAITPNDVFTITNVPYGAYTLKITDGSGCESSQEFTISESCITDNTASSRSSAPELQLTWTTPVLLIQSSFPNPFTEGTTIPIILSEDRELSIHIFTATGQLVHQAQQSFDRGAHLIELDKSVFQESGMYIYQIQQGDRIESGKLIKQQ